MDPDLGTLHLPCWTCAGYLLLVFPNASLRQFPGDALRTLVLFFQIAVCLALFAESLYQAELLAENKVRAQRCLSSGEKTWIQTLAMTNHHCLVTRLTGDAQVKPCA